MKKIAKMAVLTVLSAGLLLMGCIDKNEDDNNDGSVKVQGKLLILQAYGNAGDGSPGGVSHSFVELYNISNEAINLSGINLYYADGIRGNDVTEDAPWKSIALNGTIPAKGSFLILGKKHDDLSDTRYIITDGYGDINNNNLALNRRGFKAALIKSSETLTVQNPFTDGGNGKPVSGYIDMVGALNNPDANPPDNIFGYETAPARNSASEAVRRADLIDTDNNSTDFIAARYASTGAGAFTNEMLEVRKPRNSKAGAWSPFAAPAPPAVSENTLLIFQVYGAGFGSELGSNNNTNTGSISHNFIELYNNAASPIDLSTFSVQWANGKANGGGTIIAEDEDWNVIPLTGIIPAYGSYLIRGRKMNDQDGDVGRLQVVQGDINDDDFYMSNRSFKVALVSNQTKINISQPWDNAVKEPLINGLLDLVGARNGNNDSVEGFKGAMFDPFSKQQSIRRGSLDDTENNKNDFVGLDYRNWSAGNPTRLTDDQVTKFRPRTAAETASGYIPQF
jgi:hypothetical protein